MPIERIIDGASLTHPEVHSQILFEASNVTGHMNQFA